MLPRQLKREIIFRGRIIELLVDDVEDDAGRRSVREIAHHPGGAVTVPLFPDGNVLLVRQFRYPVGDYVLELPAGKLNPGEEPAAAAARELEEETGWKAGKLEKLTAMYTTPGFCDEVLHIYLATELVLHPDGPRREESEASMTLHALPLAEALAMVERSELRDGKTIVGLLLAARKFKNHEKA